MSASGRSCGTCRLCCKLLSVWEVGTGRDGVAYEFKKPARTWCTHAGPGGCAIHASDAKPWICRSFSCLWLDGYGREEDRPDRSGVVWNAELLGETMTAIAYTERGREAALRRPMLEFVNAALERYPLPITAVMIVENLGDVRWRYTPALGWHRCMRPEGDRADLPKEPCAADRDRAGVAEILGPEAPWAPTFDRVAFYERVRGNLELEARVRAMRPELSERVEAAMRPAPRPPAGEIAVSGARTEGETDG